MMRKVIHIALYSLRIVFRDKDALTWLFILSIIWTILWGAVYTPHSRNEKIPIGLLNRDKGVYGEIFRNMLEEQKGIKIIQQSNEVDMKNLVKKSELSAGLLIPEDFSENLMRGKHTTIKILESKRYSSHFLETLITKLSNRISIDAL